MIDPEKIVSYLASLKQFRVFNVQSKEAYDSFAPLIPNCVPRCLSTSYENSNLIAYTQSKQLILVDLAIRSAENSAQPAQAQIKREARLKALAMRADGSAVAVGDEAGKVFHIENLAACFPQTKGNVLIQTLHWHANGVNALKFMDNAPFLLSGGQESVLVQWHL